jgi:hypothetical protein
MRTSGAVIWSLMRCGFSFSGGLRPKRLLLPAAGLGRLFPGLNGLGGNGFGAAIVVENLKVKKSFLSFLCF